jgi:diguanylate cyclase (GGDEF)-like protein/PAS domain S-box-containing protein
MLSGANSEFSRLSKIRVLLLQDEANPTVVVETHLRHSTRLFEIARVRTEFDLRRSIRGFEPDVIVSDDRLTGLSAADALRITMELAPTVPLIFVCQSGDDADGAAEDAADCIDSADLSRLVPTIERVMREKVVAEGKRLAESELNQSRQRLRDIMDATQEWIWELDAHGCFTFSNGCVEDILGYTASEVLGRNRFEFVHPDDRAALNARWREIDPHGAPTTGLIARWIGRDGRVSWLDCNVVTVCDEGGRIICYRGADRDITLRRCQEEKFARLTRVNALLSRVNTAIVRYDNRLDLLHEACRLAAEQGGFRCAIAFMIEPGEISVKATAWWGVDNALVPTRQVSFAAAAAPDDADIIAAAMRSGQPVVCHDVAKANVRSILPKDAERQGIRAVVVLPLFVDGTSVGVWTLHSQDQHAFNSEELVSLQKVSGEISFALQYLSHEDMLQHLSYFDTLTGLANRRLWCERLARRLQSCDPVHHEVILAVFDLDGLSAVNDGCGRDVGDRLLQLVSERLRDIDGGSEAAAYLGAGVFAAFFEVSAERLDLTDIARVRVESLLDEPLVLDGRDIKVCARIGTSCFPSHGSDAQTLLENAEVALRRAKHSGESFVRYSARMTSDAAARLALEATLRQAVKDETFDLFYQPILSARTGRIMAVEALLRWRHPHRGIVAAGEIVPVLEDQGLIEQVGAWALHRAARDRAHWIERGGPDIRVAVNVSAAQLRRSDFVDIVMKALGKLRPQQVWLDLEVTESMLMHDVEASTQKLNQLRSRGVRIAIDDFGTGYSSLSRLASLPINTLKIDRSFVQGVGEDPRSIAIVETILSLSRSLDLNTIAEGIETDEQRLLLSNMGCDELQGYLFARPLSVADCFDFMCANQRQAPVEHDPLDGIANRTAAAGL